ncbi:hypothetical protein SAMN02910382_00050 [Butyrivibrio sp. TB]|nr:hypothetical protein SAMN02910382_00050 [Butyrivibrio sp. TB]
MKNRIKELRDFYIIWITQSLSQLGSAITDKFDRRPVAFSNCPVRLFQLAIR